MGKTKFPLPKKYWMYVVLCAALGILLFVNIFITDGITGEKEFLDFTQQDWYHFALFLLTEFFIILLMAFWAIKAGNLVNKQEKQVKQYFDQFKYAGTKPGDCDHIWFDLSGDERAKIVKSSDVYYLYVESFNYKTESWDPVNTVSVFRSLAEIKKALFYEFDFFCEENTVLNRRGDEIFRDEP